MRADFDRRLGHLFVVEYAAEHRGLLELDVLEILGRRGGNARQVRDFFGVLVDYGKLEGISDGRIEGEHAGSIGADFDKLRNTQSFLLAIDTRHADNRGIRGGTVGTLHKPSHRGREHILGIGRRSGNLFGIGTGHKERGKG